MRALASSIPARRRRSDLILGDPYCTYVSFVCSQVSVRKMCEYISKGTNDLPSTFVELLVDEVIFSIQVPCRQTQPPKSSHLRRSRGEATTVLRASAMLNSFLAITVSHADRCNFFARDRSMIPRAFESSIGHRLPDVAHQLQKAIPLLSPLNACSACHTKLITRVQRRCVREP
eukprot:6197620-Pleurochrysis_carterae.AAC.2